MHVLVVNAGSSTLKLRIIDERSDVVKGHDVDPWDGGGSAADFRRFLADGPAVDAVGHRIVHGGSDLREPTLVTAEVEATIAALAPLAPLHQDRALSALAAARRILPQSPHVACFDTAFHSTLPMAARTYALPSEWRERWHLHRFGFHGLSHAWAAARGATIAGLPGTARIITCHLGSGASLCAVVDGRSIDTTMGFTPLDGIVMATRAGAVDPGLLLWLLTDGGLDAGEVAEGLERHAGLAGFVESGDMRKVLAARDGGDPGAVLGFDVYVHRLRQGIAAMAASMGGLDLLVFTGGVGEHAAPVRADTAEGLGFLGVNVDRRANETASSDTDISPAGAAVRTVVITSREDLEITRQVRGLLGWSAERP
ncbi:acetate/propionate family kinase [Actinomarinicola tropica]|uniref:Acetate kinase n=1 Tax=Actinomarinicola tropica TaxID=2789776 RepID=A0A5Q2RLC1_9ACTN|nr:acetate/propionate family kinase [Actinomarinicola tropica]QGG96284.1 acetate/propionate family kinase [Actinomarinicola tropica]